MAPHTLSRRFADPRLLARFVLSFYDAATADARLAPYFARVDMRRLVAHQATFLRSLESRPVTPSDEELAAAHAPLGIDAAAFERMIELFGVTLDAYEIPADEAEALLAQLRARRGLIVVEA